MPYVLREGTVCVCGCVKERKTEQETFMIPLQFNYNKLPFCDNVILKLMHFHS